MFPQAAPIVALFYALYFLVTNFVLLNLIVAAVLEQYSVRDGEKRALQRRAAIRRAANTQARVCLKKPGAASCAPCQVQRVHDRKPCWLNEQ